MKENICKLCERNILIITEHHLIPKSYNGREIIEICRDCHKQLHALFDNKTLGEEFNTIELILFNKQFLDYLRWVKEGQMVLLVKLDVLERNA